MGNALLLLLQSMKSGYEFFVCLFGGGTTGHTIHIIAFAFLLLHLL